MEHRSLCAKKLVRQRKLGIGTVEYRTPRFSRVCYYIVVRRSVSYKLLKVEMLSSQFSAHLDLS